MKVLMINVVCGIRSTGRICTDLATALEAHGHEVKIAYGRENVPEKYQKYAVRIGTDLDIILHGIKARVLDGAGLGSKKATTEFIDWVKEYDPDVIHLHNIHGYYINVKLLFEYLRGCGKKIIWTLHDSWAFTGHTAYCDAIGCNRWEFGCHKCPLIYEYPSSFFDFSHRNWINKKNIFSGTPNLTLVTPSMWLKECVTRSFLKEYHVEVINNGIDTNLFCLTQSDFRKKHGIENKFVVLGVATSWDKMKGLQDYYQLAELLGEEYQVVLVGLTKKQLSVLPSNIIGIERTMNVNELAELYSTSDLFVNLSYCENYPTVNIEAIMCGTQILTYATGGSPEIVAKSGGYIIERGNIKLAVETIRNIDRNSISINKLNKNDFDRKNTTEQYLKVYERKNYESFVSY